MPYVVPCCDLLQLLILAKLSDTHLFEVTADADCQAMTMDADNVLAAMTLVCRSGMSGRVRRVELNAARRIPCGFGSGVILTRWTRRMEFRATWPNQQA